jgi:hypothetical protein
MRTLTTTSQPPVGRLRSGAARLLRRGRGINDTASFTPLIEREGRRSAARRPAHVAACAGAGTAYPPPSPRSLCPLQPRRSRELARGHPLRTPRRRTRNEAGQMTSKRTPALGSNAVRHTDVVRGIEGSGAFRSLLGCRRRARRWWRSGRTVTGCAGVGAATFIGGGPSALVPVGAGLAAVVRSRAHAATSSADDLEPGFSKLLVRDVDEPGGSLGAGRVGGRCGDETVSPDCVHPPQPWPRVARDA